LVSARHPAVDSVIFLGVGIQANQGRMEKTGPFYPDHGLERIVGYHDRQDRRFTEAAAAISADVGKPILTATELSMADPSNPAVVGCRESGKLCYVSANRAVIALSHLWEYARQPSAARSSLNSLPRRRLQWYVAAAGPRDRRRLRRLGGRASGEGAGGDRGARRPSPITSVLSARRVPELIAAPVADNRLIAHLTDLMSRSPESRVPHRRREWPHGVQRPPERPPDPGVDREAHDRASGRVGARSDTVLTTKAMSTAPPDNGQLTGDLSLVGGGDPLLMTDPYVQHFKHQPVTHTDLGTLADRIVAAGITHVTGNVVGDGLALRRATLPSAVAADSRVGGDRPTQRTHRERRPRGVPSDARCEDAEGEGGRRCRAARRRSAEAVVVLKGVVIDGAAATGRAPDGSTEDRPHRLATDQPDDQRDV